MRDLLEVKQKPWKSFALVRMEVEAHTGGPWLELRHPWTDESTGSNNYKESAPYEEDDVSLSHLQVKIDN